MSKSNKKEAGWIVTFADLMALLLTFFVLLFSFSTIDAKKYEAVAVSLKAAFGFHPWNILGERGKSGIGGSLIGIDIPPPPPAPPPAPKTKREVKQAVKPKPETAQARQSPRPAKEKEPKPPAQTGSLQKSLKDRLAGLLEQQINSGDATLLARNGTVIIRFDEKVTFASGSAELVPTFKAILARIVPVIEKSKGQVIVSGHTDDRPITSKRFRSNWDLSAGRAVSVVHYVLSITGLPANRIVAQGRADTVPLFANDSENHRAKNRRVEIRIVRTGPPGNTK